MKILVFDKFLGYQIGGAQNSLHYLLKNLSGDFEFLACEVKKAFLAEKYKLEDWEVERVKIKEFPRFPYFEYWLNRQKIQKFIAGKKGDLLMAQGLWGAIAINAFSGRTIYFIRDEYHFNKIPIYQTGLKKFFKKIYIFFQSPFIKKFFLDNQKAIEKADLVIANSFFIAEKIKTIFNKETEVVYPLVDVLKFQNVQLPPVEKRFFLTLIGSELIKGKPIVEKLAQTMPKKFFLIVGRDFKKVFWRRNILYFPWQKDPLEIYEKTKVLLVPSIGGEAFSRVCVEAMALGIPVVASRRGGLPEVLDEEFLVEDVWDIKLWQEKILNIENNYENYQKILRQKSLSFDQREQIKKFKNIFKENFGIDL